MGPVSTGAAHNQQEDELLSTCLSLLDIKHADGFKMVDMSRNAFQKPNSKAFELILYHTFSIIKGKAAAKKTLRGLWPLLEKDRKQIKDFYQRMQEWLKESGRFPDTSLATFQRNPSGHRLVTFLCDLAHWALEVQHARLYPDDALDQPAVEDDALLMDMAEPVLVAARAHNHLQVDRLLTLCQQGFQLQQQAEAAGAELTQRYYEVSAQLREAQAEGGCDPSCSAPGMKVASVLPAHLDGSSRELEAGAASCTPADLLERQQKVQQLWCELDQSVQSCEALQSMVKHLAGSEGHPYAIDAVQLRACSQAGGCYDVSTTSSAALDIAGLVEAWLFDVGSVCRYVKTLAGQTASLDQQQDSQQRGWLPVQASSMGRCSFMSPLVATSDAASHATHLYAQLSLHRNCRGGLLGLKATLEQQLNEAACRMQALQAELSPIFEQEVAQAHAAEAQLSIPAPAGSTEAAGLLAGLGPGCIAPEAEAFWGDGAGGGLVKCQLQLIPPTPLLHQQVAGRQHQHPLESVSQGLPALGIRSSSQQQQTAVCAPCPELSSCRDNTACAGADPHSCCSDDMGAAGGVLVPCPGDSPDPYDSMQHSPISCASSSQQPAAALLMSQELMDLNLVDDFDDVADHGGIFSTQQQNAQRDKRVDAARISFARFSLGTDVLSPLLAAAGDGQTWQTAESSTSRRGATGAPVLFPVEEDCASEGSHEQADGCHHTRYGQQNPSQGSLQAKPNRQGQSAAPHETLLAERSGQTAAPQGDTGDAGAGATCAHDTETPAAIPTHAVECLASISGSADSLSSAKPRRLTYAAAANVEGGVESLQGTAMTDTAGSLSPSSIEDDNDLEPSSSQHGRVKLPLALLKERMQRLQAAG